MTESTTTISFRVSPEIKEQIQEVAKSHGQNKSDWFRDLAMRSLHTAAPTAPPEPVPPSDSSELLSALIEALEPRLRVIERAYQEGIETMKAALEELGAIQHKHLCEFAQLMLDLDESAESNLIASRDEILDAIERFKASQRSHKDTLPKATSQAQRRGPGGY